MKRGGEKRPGREARQYRLDKLRRQSLKPAPDTDGRHMGGEMRRNVSVDCGWGRLHFAQTFDRIEDVVAALEAEKPEQRDIAFYLRDPQVALARAPQALFLDPSHTLRLDLHTYKPSRRRFAGFHLRRLASRSDAEEVNRIYAARHMVQVDPVFLRDGRDNREITLFVAEAEETGAILGCVTGVDHARAFNDPERGSSLWCLAVDPRASQPGIGEALVRRLAEHFQTRSAAFMDLSVLHDNEQAIALYEKIGFTRVPFFALKNKNAINEKLFAGPSFDVRLNPYAMIIVDEARRRGIHVEMIDAEASYFRLVFGGRSIICRESLSELTSAIAMSRCADKMVTRRLLGAADLHVPAQQSAGSKERNATFLEEHGTVVVKPRHGEQGRGVSVGLVDMPALERAIRAAREHDEEVILEQFVEGLDLRIIVIGYRLVAGAIRRPPQVVGDGNSSIRALIERQSRRRAAATGGESRIPLDAETRRMVAASGHDLDDVLDVGVAVTVRGTANLHTGGTIHDVTDRLHPRLCDAAIRCARVIDIPVAGVDMIVRDPTKEDYVIIEANERPGLANHEPQPTAERFIDLLFPHSAPAGVKLQQTGARSS